MNKPTERDWKAAALICRDVAELPDRDQCEHMTLDDMLVTADELQPMIAMALSIARTEEREACARIAADQATGPEAAERIREQK